MSLYGRHGRIVAKPGQRDALLAILETGTKAKDMPGCRLYVIGRAADDAQTLMITEIWDDAAAHAASLKLPAVGEAIAKAMPLIESVDGAAMDVAAGFADA